MSQESRQWELVLLGATGYTGKLTAEYISEHLPTDLTWAVAGRNAKKLQTVVDELARLSPDRKQPAIEVCELKKDQLDALAKKTRLIITTVGPYLYYGEAALAACAENGTHYLDCTGEVPWHLDMIKKYNEIAKKSGAIIIPQSGLDSVPADISAYVFAKHIRRVYNAGTSSVMFTLHDVKSGVSGGTSTTILDLFEAYSLSKLSAAMKPFAMSPVAPGKSLGRPQSGILYRLLGLLKVPELEGVQTTGPMAAVDRSLAHRSWGLYEMIARDGSGFSYGARFRFNEYMRARNIVTATLVKVVFALVGALLAIPVTRWILSPLIRRFVIPAPGEGPTKETMKNDFFDYRVVAVADTASKERVTGRINFAYGGYAVTALTLAEAAAVILRGDLATTGAGRLGGGLLTPATLGDQYVDRLKAAGVSIEIGH